LALSDKTKVFFVMLNSNQKLNFIEQEKVDIVVFSPNGSYLATVAEDLSKQKYTVSVWDFSSRKELIRIPHEDILYSLAFSKDEKYLATTGRFGTTHIWQIDTGQESTRINHDTYVHKIIFSPVYDEEYILADSSGQIWKLDPIPEVISIDYKTKNVTTFNSELMSGSVFSPDCKYLAIIHENNNIQIWEIVNGKKLASLITYNMPIKLLYFSPDGEYIATVSKDNTLFIKKWKDGKNESLVLINGKDLGKLIRSLIFSPDGKYLAVAIEITSDRMWQIRVLYLGDKIIDLQTPQNPVNHIWEILSQGEHRYITDEEIETTVVQQNINVQKTKVNDVNLIYHEENLYLAIAKSNGSAIIWNIITGNKRMQVSH
ncbi:hypothetical protein, partial [Nostoc sp. LEGE 12450]|uniref:WD40 repeat domain-containing protein n=1 Tax=Nostoc sp. LEGE 12450 TaxID=1828643 RepID=UPI001881666C|nr:hypothetical protein [Nostoc sp. LEGE 12450]